jgi:hypothetical protein
MLDTATGAVWQYAFGNYCWSKSPPLDVRQIELFELCKDSEDSIPKVPVFERVSVEGLYKTPTLALIDQSIQAQAKRASEDRLKQQWKPKE